MEDAAAVFAGEETVEAVGANDDGARAVVCVSADPKIRGLPMCAGAGAAAVVDPLAARVEMEALVEGGEWVFGCLGVCVGFFLGWCWDRA